MVIRSLPLLVTSIMAFFLLSGLLVWVVARLLRSNREQLLASGPMTAEQEFALREAVALLLLVEVLASDRIFVNWNSKWSNGHPGERRS